MSYKAFEEWTDTNRDFDYCFDCCDFAYEQLESAFNAGHIDGRKHQAEVDIGLAESEKCATPDCCATDVAVLIRETARHEDETGDQLLESDGSDTPRSECCGAEMHDWPDSDLCPDCLEHTGIEEDE